MRFNNKNVILPTPVLNLFRFEALENSTFGMRERSTNLTTLEYSLDGDSWTNLTTSTTVSLNAGEKAYIRGKLTGNNALQDFTRFSMTGKLAAKGNIMYLYDYEHPESTTITYEYAFRATFNGCTSLYDISELLLPATTLSTGVYMGTFLGTSITSSPELPAVNLTTSCYQGMFSNCTSLVDTPILRATTLTSKCYESMFNGSSMVNKVISYATSVNASNMYLWLNGVSSTGDFYNLGGATYSRNASGIPSGWTIHASL